MKKIFLLFFIVLFLIPVVLAVPVSYKGTITYDGADITTEHILTAVSASRTTTKTISQNNFVVNHLVKKGEIVKFYFDDDLFTEYTQPLPGSVVDLGVWDISAGGLTSDLYKAKSDLTYELILNGNPSKDNVIADLYLPTSLAAYATVTIGWASDDASIAINGTVTRDGSDHTVTLTATLSEEGETPLTSTFTVTVKQVVAAVVPDEDGKVEINYSEPEVVIDTSNINLTKSIEIPETVLPNEVVSLNLESLKVGNTVTLGSNDLTLTRKTNSTVNYSVELSAGTEISGASDWNGLLTLPTVKDNTEVETTEGDTDLVIEVGYTGGQLNFTKAVKLVLAGMTGKSVGYTHGTDLTTITLVCNSATNADNIVGNGECYFDDGTDLIIWTKHFTKFAAYTETAAPSPAAPTGGAPAPTGPTGGGIPGPITTPTPAPEEEEEVEEAPEEEEVAEEVEEVPEEEAPGGLAAITGRAIDALGGLAGKVKWWQTAIVVVIVVALIGGYYYFTYGEPSVSNADAYYSRAANLHRKAEELYRTGKTEKSNELYKKAQKYREKGEKLQK